MIILNNYNALPRCKILQSVYKSWGTTCAHSQFFAVSPSPITPLRLHAVNLLSQEHISLWIVGRQSPYVYVCMHVSLCMYVWSSAYLWLYILTCFILTSKVLKLKRICVCMYVCVCVCVLACVCVCLRIFVLDCLQAHACLLDLVFFTPLGVQIFNSALSPLSVFGCLLTVFQVILMGFD